MNLDHLFNGHTIINNFIRMKIRLFLYNFLVGLSLNAQTMLDTMYFDSPIKHDVVLAGSFGEL